MTTHPIYGMLLLAYLFIVVPAYAEDGIRYYDDLEDLCQDLAYRAERSAELRDAGAQWDLFERMIQVHPEKHRDVFAWTYGSVFRYPRVSPQEEGNKVMAECMKSLD